MGILVGAIMKRSIVLTWGLFAAVGLQGCSSEPSLVSGNKRGGIISNVNVSDKSAVLSLADSHCSQYGEVARITIVDVHGSRVKFLCIEPPRKEPGPNPLLRTMAPASTI